MMAAVFSMQGFGQLLAAIVALLTTVAFKQSFIEVTSLSACDYSCQLAADRSWRIIIGVGALPACFALYYRITIPETPRYTFDVAHDIEKADADIRAYMASKGDGEVDSVQRAKARKDAANTLTLPNASWGDVYAYFSQWKNLKVLLGTTLSWFFLVSFPTSPLSLSLSRMALDSVPLSRGLLTEHRIWPFTASASTTPSSSRPSATRAARRCTTSCTTTRWA